VELSVRGGEREKSAIEATQIKYITIKLKGGACNPGDQGNRGGVQTSDKLSDRGSDKGLGSGTGLGNGICGVHKLMERL